LASINIIEFVDDVRVMADPKTGARYRVIVISAER
jgi:hypothetical protein